MAWKRSTAKTCDRICHQQHSAGSKQRSHAVIPHYLFDATTTYVGTLQGISVPSLAAPASPASSRHRQRRSFSSYCRRITADISQRRTASAGNTVHDHRERKAEDTGCSPANWRQYFQSGTPAWYQPAKPYEKHDPPLMGSRVFTIRTIYFTISIVRKSLMVRKNLLTPPPELGLWHCPACLSQK